MEYEGASLKTFRFEEGCISFQNLSCKSLGESLNGAVDCRREVSRVEKMSLEELQKQMEAGEIKAFLVDNDIP